MIFHHELLPKVKLPRETIDGVRYYTTPTGLKVPSVTTVLKKYYDKGKEIQKWRKRIGVKKANAITQQAANRGKSVHKICEDYLGNDPKAMSKAMPDSLADFERMKDLLDKNVSKVFGIELPLYSNELMTAGTTDLACIWNNYPTVIDYKTSKKPKKEEWIENYFVQSSTYALIIKEQYGIDIPKIGVILLVEHSYPEVFIKNVSDYEDKVKEIFITSREGTK